MKPIYSTLTKQKVEHQVFKDSVNLKIDILTTVIEHKNVTIQDTEDALEELQEKVDIAYKQLANNIDELDKIYTLRDSLNKNTKTQYTDEDRNIWLNNEFYLSPNANDSNR